MILTHIRNKQLLVHNAAYYEDISLVVSCAKHLLFGVPGVGEGAKRVPRAAHPAEDAQHGGGGGSGGHHQEE